MQQSLKRPQVPKQRSLRKNIIWSFAGNIVPLLAAIICIPILIDNLGVDRFGLLALVWLTIGYFNFLDMGLGRSLTKLVAESLGAGRSEEVPEIIQTGMTALLLLSLIGCVVVLLVSPYLLHLLQIPSGLLQETRRSLYLLALAVPATIVMAGLRGILEAYQRFDLVAIIRVPLALFNYVGPILIFPISKSLYAVVAVLVVGRVLSLLLCFFTLNRLGISFGKIGAIKINFLKPLLKFGGWMTVTNIIGPIMVYMDRFLIGAILSAAAVAYYVTPYEMITKMLIIPGVIVGVLFPALSAVVNIDAVKADSLLIQGLRTIFWVVFPVVLVAFLFSQEIIGYWIDFDFADHSQVAMRWLAVGVLFNSLAQVWCILVQSSGRADISAKIHFVELPFYLVLLWWLTKTFGITGTALAWTLRILVDALAFCFVSIRLFPSIRSTIFVSMLMLLVGSASLGAGAVITAPAWKLLYLITVLFGVWLLLRNWRQPIQPAPVKVQ